MVLTSKQSLFVICERKKETKINYIMFAFWCLRMCIIIDYCNNILQRTGNILCFKNELFFYNFVLVMYGLYYIWGLVTWFWFSD